MCWFRIRAHTRKNRWGKKKTVVNVSWQICFLLLFYFNDFSLRRGFYSSIRYKYFFSVTLTRSSCSLDTDIGCAFEWVYMCTKVKELDFGFYCPLVLFATLNFNSLLFLYSAEWTRDIYKHYTLRKICAYFHWINRVFSLVLSLFFTWALLSE